MGDMDAPGALQRVFGRLHGPFRILWFLTFAYAVIAGAYSGLWLEQQRSALARPFGELGLRYHPHRGQNELGRPWVSDGPHAAIRPDDRILAIDGRPAPQSADDLAALSAQLESAPGPVVQLTLRSPDGTQKTVGIRRDAGYVARAYAGSGFTEDSQRIVRLVLRMLQGAAFIGVAALLFQRRPRDPVAGLLSLALLVQSAVLYTTRTHAFMPGARLADAFLEPVSAGLFLFCVLVFPEGRLTPRWTRPAALAIAAWALAGIPVSLGLLPDGAVPVMDAGGIALIAVTVVAMVARYRQMPPGAARQQIRWTLFGFAAAGVLMVPTTIVSNLADAATGPLAIRLSMAAWTTFFVASLVAVGGLLVSLLRYRLYDAEAVISRSAGYAILTVALGAVWTGSEQAISQLFEGAFGQTAGGASTAIAAGLAAALITPTHDFVLRWTERVFQRGLTHLRAELPKAVSDLRETAPAAVLAQVVAARIGAGVRSRRAAVLLPDGAGGWRTGAAWEVDPERVDGWLDGWSAPTGGEALTRRADDIFPIQAPLTVGHEASDTPAGWLLLGPRPDGSFPGKDEREVLEELLDPVARGLRVAGLREAREAALQAELAALRAELKALKAG